MEQQIPVVFQIAGHHMVKRNREDSSGLASVPQRRILRVRGIQVLIQKILQPAINRLVGLAGVRRVFQPQAQIIQLSQHGRVFGT